jgi:hypothetical protein
LREIFYLQIQINGQGWATGYLHDDQGIQKEYPYLPLLLNGFAAAYALRRDLLAL